MTARLLLVAVFSLVAAAVAGTAAAAAIVTLPLVMDQPDKLLSPGGIALIGFALALVYGLLSPGKQAVPCSQKRQASATDRLPCASMAAASTTPDSARLAATH